MGFCFIFRSAIIGATAEEPVWVWQHLIISCWSGRRVALTSPDLLLLAAIIEIAGCQTQPSPPCDYSMTEAFTRRCQISLFVCQTSDGAIKIWQTACYSVGETADEGIVAHGYSLTRQLGCVWVIAWDCRHRGNDTAFVSLWVVLKKNVDYVLYGVATEFADVSHTWFAAWSPGKM